jgi:hypothetical protein
MRWEFRIPTDFIGKFTAGQKREIVQLGWLDQFIQVRLAPEVVDQAALFSTSKNRC